MVILTDAQLTTLRAHPHQMKFYLAIHDPRLVGKFRLAATVGTGSRVLTYQEIQWEPNPEGGPFVIADLRAGMTVTTPDGERIRLKSWYENPPGEGTGVLRVPPNNIAWVEDMWVSVYDVHEPWSIFPRILTGKQVDTITLTGASGTANIIGTGGFTKLATFHDDLATTASDFVTAYALDYLTADVVVTSDGANIVFTSATAGEGFSHSTIETVTGDLNGTLDYGGTEEILFIYQDYDQAYAGQTDVCRPVVIMGGPVIGFLDPVAGFTAYFDGSQSYGLDGATIVTYAWKFRGCIPFSALTSDPTPGNVVWQQAGTFMAELTVTDSNGRSSTGYRPVIIFDGRNIVENPAATFVPYTAFEVSSLEGAWTDGTWRASFTLRGETIPTALRDNAQVILFAEGLAQETYDLPVAGNNTHRSNLLFVGWAKGETITKQPFTNWVTFDAAGICGKMADMQQYSDTYEVPASALPAHWYGPEHLSYAKNWYELDRPNVDLIMMAHLRWRSTILDIVDVHWMNLTADKAKIRHDFTEGNLYEQCQTLMDTVCGRIGSDKTSAIYMRVDPQVLPSINNWRENIDTIFDIWEGDWRDEVVIERHTSPSVSSVDLSGVWYDLAGIDPEVNAHPLFALAPSDPDQNRLVPPYWGVCEKRDGLVLEGMSVGTSSAQACQLCGDLYAQLNNEFPKSQMKMAGAWMCLDVFPPEWVLWTVPPDWTKRGIYWNAARFLIRRVQIECSNESQTATVSIDLEKETDGQDAAPIQYEGLG